MADRPSQPSTAGPPPVELPSPKGYARTVDDLRAELASATSRALLARLSAGTAWDGHGPAGAARARRLVIGPPRPARALARAAGTPDGLLPPAPITVWEDAAGAVRVGYAPLAPALVRRGRPTVGALAELVDGLRAHLAAAAVHPAPPPEAAR